jgi:hypothetical protein
LRAARGHAVHVRVTGPLGLLSATVRPPLHGRDHHSYSRDGHEVASLYQPCVRSCRRLSRYAESLRKLVARLDRLAWWPLSCPDLSLKHPRYLEVSRDPGEVVKIIRHAGHPS